jgi:hypothetical protein
MSELQSYVDTCDFDAIDGVGKWGGVHTKTLTFVSVAE